MDRRTFVKKLGLGTVASAAVAGTLAKADSGSAAATAPEPFEIVVVGGGFGGASVAKYIALWGGAAVKVTLVDSNAAHVSCILSNLVLNNQKTLANLTFPLVKAAEKYQFAFKQGAVAGMGAELNGSRFIALADGSKIYFDKLVLSPGIDFDFPRGMVQNGWTDTNTPFPHAWKAGLQTNNLRDQLKMLPGGGKARVVMTIPPKPYRCPPGPYERACLIADYLKNKKGGGKLFVLDANPAIQAEPVNFGKAFSGLYKGIIEYQPNAAVNAVSAAAAFNPRLALPQDKTINVSYTGALPANPIGSGQKFHLINVIPKQKAADLLFGTDFRHLLGGKAWAGVHIDTYQSLYDNDVYVIGDAHDSVQPKAGHIANSEAKVCADALLRHLQLRPARVMPDEAPVTNSACFSPITASTASFLTAGYRYNPALDTMEKIAAASGEAEQINSDNYKMMLAWANNLFAEVF
ncbi:NAD(P)/FAD-dependent oxidoreductase [Methylomonas sp. SURF-1]|uniref:NAD(P)/FAD-dependent oxidoreductase n=1 Tax=Methylomonas aurea TaxID=2952224 RepID=A0ABT1UMA2_9GAMM|nr:FAD/NAD(P)-binding oxidoreductase [Methylomonas sp. SURF-1]MCQ8183368.1 NAD(P)/FAD-dependent oxidoreductase [Methylomonas sp. SURF-1]